MFADISITTEAAVAIGALLTALCTVIGVQWRYIVTQTTKIESIYQQWLAERDRRIDHDSNP